MTRQPPAGAPTPERKPGHEPGTSRVLPGQPMDDPIPPEMSPEDDMPELPPTHEEDRPAA